MAAEPGAAARRPARDGSVADMNMPPAASLVVAGARSASSWSSGPTSLWLSFHISSSLFIDRRFIAFDSRSNFFSRC